MHKQNQKHALDITKNTYNKALSFSHLSGSGGGGAGRINGKNPFDESSVQEKLASGTVFLYNPLFLLQSDEKNLFSKNEITL